MARKRRFGPTSIDRYQLKAYRVHYMPGVPEDLVRTVAMNQTASFTSGFGMYTTVWRERVVPILEKHNVPKMDYAKYRAFMNEFLSKVATKGTASPEELVEKWAGQGCDRGILAEIVEAITQKKEEHEG